MGTKMIRIKNNLIKIVKKKIFRLMITKNK